MLYELIGRNAGTPTRTVISTRFSDCCGIHPHHCQTLLATAMVEGTGLRISGHDNIIVEMSAEEVATERWDISTIRARSKDLAALAGSCLVPRALRA